MDEIKQFLKENYDFDVKEIFPLKNGVQNSNYCVATEQENYVFRIYNRKSLAEIKYAILLLTELQKHNFPAPGLVLTKQGQSAFLFQEKPCLVYKHLPGTNTELKSPSLLAQLGELQAKLHLYLRNERQEPAELTWDLADLLQIIEKNKDLLNFEFPEYLETTNFIISELKKFSFSSELPKGGTHQDIKPENVLVKDNQVTGIVDFDNGYYGELLPDLMTSVIWYCFEDNKLQPELLKSFLTGYQKHRLLEQNEKDCFNQMLKFRLLREAIIWPMYVSHQKEVAKKYIDYFLNLYKMLNIGLKHFHDEKHESVLKS